MMCARFNAGSKAAVPVVVVAYSRIECGLAGNAVECDELACAPSVAIALLACRGRGGGRRAKHLEDADSSWFMVSGDVGSQVPYASCRLAWGAPRSRRAVWAGRLAKSEHAELLEAVRLGAAAVRLSELCLARGAHACRCPYGLKWSCHPTCAWCVAIVLQTQTVQLASFECLGREIHGEAGI
jgi:hypothetical protein